MIYKNVSVVVLALIVVLFIVPPMVSAPNTVSVLTGIAIGVSTVIVAVKIILKGNKK